MLNIRAIFDNTHAFIGLLSPSGILLEANQSFLDFIGVESVQVPGNPFWETQWWIDSPGSARKLKDAVTKSVRGIFTRFDTEHTDVDGNRNYIDFTVTPVYDEKRKVVSLVIEGRDITALTESRLALIESEKRFRSLVELSSDWYWEQDEQYRFVEISGNSDNFTDTRVGSYIGKCRWEISIPNSGEVDWSGHKALLARHESFRDFEHKRSNKAGETIWICTSGDPVFDSENNFRGYRGTSRNITNQKLSEFADKENEMRQRLAVDIAGIGIWEWDMVSNQVIWDDKQFELFGIKRVEGSIPLSTTIDAIHPDDRERLSNKARKVLEEGATAAEEFRIVHSDGSVRWLLGASGVVKFNETGSSARLIGVNMDITKRKETETSLRASQEQLQAVNETLENRIADRTAELEAEAEQHKKTQSKLDQSRRLDSIGQLAGGVAHDFNNLLAVISGNLELAAPYVTHDDAKDRIAVALMAAETGSNLNQRLLSFARKRKLSPVRISTADCVLDTVHLLTRTLGEDVRIVTDADPGLWDTFVDTGEIESALVNLAVNARDAMPGGGSLTIEMRNMALRVDDAELNSDAQAGEYVGISVTDTGTGMSTNVMERALEPFFTTKNEGKSTGLGLSSVYGFAKAFGGFLTLDSHVGEGTTVRLYLPRAPEEVDFKPALASAKQASYSNNELILVVEDQPIVRILTVDRLKNLGYRVVEASTAQEAIDVLKIGTPVNLVFTDIVMPGGITGYELADWITINRNDVRVLLTSGYIDPSSRSNDGSTSSNLEVLIKPYSLDLLAQRIQEAMEQPTLA